MKWVLILLSYNLLWLIPQNIPTNASPRLSNRIFAGYHGLSFTLAIKEAQVLNIDDVSLKILSYEDLIKNKRITNRLKDQLDVEELEKRKKLKNG